MKRMMPAMFLSAILLSGCYDDYYFEESETTAVSQIQTTTAESAEEESHTKDSTDAPSIAEVTAIPPQEDAPEQEPQENPPEQPDEQEPSEDTPEETTGEPTTEPKFSTETTTTETTTTETTTSDETEPSEPEQTTETAISEPTAEPPNITEPITENAAESPTEPEQTDYEKALAVYECIRENGYGTCVQYSSQTYDLCQELGLPCWYVWTDAGIYGHVANTVCVDGIWFIMDTQAGCFLDYNYGFTEVVDKDMNHIGDADMLSNYSYSELFG